MTADNIRIFPRVNTALAGHTRVEETCPKCKTPLSEEYHGWVREHQPHPHTEKCVLKYDFCLVPCPTCSGGVEAKRKARMTNMLFQDSNIPFYAKDWTFMSYPQDADQHASDEVQLQLKHWFEQRQAKRAIYLVGGKGHCKTSLAISALQLWLQQGHSGLFLSTVEMFDILKGAIAASKRNETYQDTYEAGRGAQVLELVKSAELLVLDDLGVECGSKYEIRELYLILEARRSTGLFTIFTSNREARDLEHYWGDGKAVFQDGQRIIDRIGEYAFPVKVQGRNQRERV